MKPCSFPALAFLFVAFAAPALAQSQACPITFPLETKELTCTCGPGTHEFDIWGSGPYSSDSPICSAAVHAGAIGPDGGEVTVFGVEPPEEWLASTANGVTSLTFDGPWGSGYVFAGAEDAGTNAVTASP